MASSLVAKVSWGFGKVLFENFRLQFGLMHEHIGSWDQRTLMSTPRRIVCVDRYYRCVFTIVRRTFHRIVLSVSRGYFAVKLQLSILSDISDS